MDKDKLAAVVQQKLDAQVGPKADSVACDDDLPAKVGATQHCVLTAGRGCVGNRTRTSTQYRRASRPAGRQLRSLALRNRVIHGAVQRYEHALVSCDFAVDLPTELSA